MQSSHELVDNISLVCSQKSPSMPFSEGSCWRIRRVQSQFVFKLPDYEEIKPAIDSIGLILDFRSSIAVAGVAIQPLLDLQVHAGFLVEHL